MSVQRCVGVPTGCLAPGWYKCSHSSFTRFYTNFHSHESFSVPLQLCTHFYDYPNLYSLFTNPITWHRHNNEYPIRICTIFLSKESTFSKTDLVQDAGHRNRAQLHIHLHHNAVSLLQSRSTYRVYLLASYNVFLLHFWYVLNRLYRNINFSLYALSFRIKMWQIKETPFSKKKKLGRFFAFFSLSILSLLNYSLISEFYFIFCVIWYRFNCCGTNHLVKLLW